MRQKNEARSVIRTLQTGNFYAECPCCGDPIPLKDAGLFHLNDFTPQALKLYEQKKAELKDIRKELRERLKSIPKKSEASAQAINIGFILERIAPTMGGFRFDRNDCRSLFDPIDYVIFEGLTKKGAVSKILLAEIKTGASKLTEKQRQIRTLVEKKKLEWDTYEPEGSK